MSTHSNKASHTAGSYSYLHQLAQSYREFVHSPISMAYHRQPYGGRRDHGRRGADDDDYEAPYQRGVYDRYPPQQRAVHADDQAPNQQTEHHDRHLPNKRPVEAHQQPSGHQAVYPRQPPNYQPSERNKNKSYGRDDDRDNDDNNETEEKDEETIPKAPAAAAPSANKYGGGHGTAYNRPDYNSNSRHRNTDRTTQGNRWADRGRSGVGCDDNDRDNNDDNETEDKDEETIAERAKPNASAAAVPSGNKYGGGYGASSNRHDYNSNSRHNDHRNNERTAQGNRLADRGGSDVGYSGGYGHTYNNRRNAATAAVEVVADDDNDAEQLRKDVANRFTLSPRRHHVVEKKPGEASHGQPNVTVVKELKLYLEHNKIENFAFKKRERGKGRKHDKQ